MPPKKAKVLSLTQALSQLLGKTLLPDLEARAEEPAIEAVLRQRYDAEKRAERTAESFREFVARTLEQVAAAWILSCVFVRVLEDRKLLLRNRIAGEGAQDSEQLFFELAPSLTARDYLLTVFDEVSSLPGAADVLGPRHNPAFRFSPSNEGARALLDFFRERDPSDALRWQFAGDNTRFLGDLYQDLSEDVRKRYALLQTPGFVEAFILDQTLTPAIEEFGLENVRVIDPTCGSGHFLLGAFERLLDARLRAAPGVDVRTQALAALDQVYGVDVNPYAVAIARFRLTLAYLSRCGFTRLAQAPKLQLNLVVADSLLHGADKTTLYFTEHQSARGDEGAWGLSMFALDDPEEAQRVLNKRYHAVVGNPPYITCKDAKLRALYPRLYTSCAMNFALSVPFTERFFQLADDAGYIGMINANSFMKREFGRSLIQKVLPRLDLTRVIDTAGAYIPGHGTPTVVLFGRNRKPSSEQVSAVLGKRGEPSTPDDPEHGRVWSSIADHFDDDGFENDYVSVTRISRSTLDRHPWSLGGGGSADLKELLEQRAEQRLSDVVDDIGFSIILGEDELFLRPRGRPQWSHLPRMPIVIGEEIRDWSLTYTDEILRPFDEATFDVRSSPELEKELWPWKSVLQARIVSGSTSMKQAGRAWFDVRRLSRAKHSTPLSITFAEVATHNHFVLDRGGKVFKQTAPIIKLPESATEDDHLALLAYLNSSTACFWMKQVFFPKMSGTNVGEVRGQEERIAYQYAGTGLAALPLPKKWERLAEYGRALVDLAQQRAEVHPFIVLQTTNGASHTTVTSALNEAAGRWDELLEQMVVVQEELDWEVYRRFGLTTITGQAPSSVAGERAKSDERPYLCHEPLIARWGVYRKNICGHLELLEQRTFKRPWFGRQGVFHRDARSYTGEIDSAFEAKILDELECRFLSSSHHGGPIPATAIVTMLMELADEVTGRSSSVRELLEREAVPHLASYRYSESGRRKYGEWAQIWHLQRREDAGEAIELTPGPPKYDQKDFRRPEYFRLRGKLDVPKERFISYPDCQKDGDDSPLIGWAGWNHLQRAQALIALYQERKLEDGWPKDRLMPMLVGLHELMFWLEVWHGKPEAGSDNPAREIRQYVDAELSAHKLTTADLEAWRPTDNKKPRKSKGKAKAHDA